MCKENKETLDLKCNHCKKNGCKKCITFICNDCEWYMCERCKNNDDIKCGCYGYCTSCDTEVNRNLNCEPCSSCKQWLCDDCDNEKECIDCNPKCKQFNNLLRQIEVMIMDNVENIKELYVKTHKIENSKEKLDKQFKIGKIYESFYSDVMEEIHGIPWIKDLKHKNDEHCKLCSCYSSITREDNIFTINYKYGIAFDYGYDTSKPIKYSLKHKIKYENKTFYYMNYQRITKDDKEIIEEDNNETMMEYKDIIEKIKSLENEVHDLQVL